MVWAVQRDTGFGQHPVGGGHGQLVGGDGFSDRHVWQDNVGHQQDVERVLGATVHTATAPDDLGQLGFTNLRPDRLAQRVWMAIGFRQLGAGRGFPDRVTTVIPTGQQRHMGAGQALGQG